MVIAAFYVAAHTYMPENKRLGSYFIHMKIERVECLCCKTVYDVHETGSRFPWNDKEEYYCPVCGESGGTIKTHYTLEERVISLSETVEPYKSQYGSRKKIE